MKSQNHCEPPQSSKHQTNLLILFCAILTQFCFVHQFSVFSPLANSFGARTTFSSHWLCYVHSSCVCHSLSTYLHSHCACFTHSLLTPVLSELATHFPDLSSALTVRDAHSMFTVLWLVGGKQWGKASVVHILLCEGQAREVRWSVAPFRNKDRQWHQGR